MKKFLFVIAAGVLALTASAEKKVYEPNKFFDNWYIGLQGGSVSPTTGHAFWGDARGTFGLNFGKQLTPVFGLEFEGEAYINTYCSDIDRPMNTIGEMTKRQIGGGNVIDATYVGVNGLINFMNLFGGYNGKPRVFEINGRVGAGWMHKYYPSSYEVNELNTMAVKFGLDLNFNCGKLRAWTINVKPAIMYRVGLESGSDHHVNKGLFDVRASNIELLAGVTYHFKGSNGKHYISFGRAYDQAEVDGLNAQINSLRGQLNDCEGVNAQKDQKIRDLEKALQDCLNKKPAEVVKEVSKVSEVPAFNIIFDLGKSNLDNSQVKNVKLLGQYLKNHPNAKVEIKGYASKEGPVELNKKLADARAKVVKDYLMKNYGVAADRINAVGCGVTEAYGAPELNRISVCIVE